MFNPAEANYAHGILVELPYPTNEVRLLTKAFMQAVDLYLSAWFQIQQSRVSYGRWCCAHRQPSQEPHPAVDSWPCQRVVCQIAAQWQAPEVFSAARRNLALSDRLCAGRPEMVTQQYLETLDRQGLTEKITLHMIAAAIC